MISWNLSPDYGAWIPAACNPAGPPTLDVSLAQFRVSYAEVHFFLACLIHIFLRCPLLQMASIFIEVLKHTQDFNLSSYYNGATLGCMAEEKTWDRQLPSPPRLDDTGSDYDWRILLI